MATDEQRVQPPAPPAPAPVGGVIFLVGFGLHLVRVKNKGAAPGSATEETQDTHSLAGSSRPWARVVVRGGIQEVKGGFTKSCTGCRRSVSGRPPPPCPCPWHAGSGPGGLTADTCPASPRSQAGGPVAAPGRSLRQAFVPGFQLRAGWSPTQPCEAHVLDGGRSSRLLFWKREGVSTCALDGFWQKLFLGSHRNV